MNFDDVLKEIDSWITKYGPYKDKFLLTVDSEYDFYVMCIESDKLLIQAVKKDVTMD